MLNALFNSLLKSFPHLGINKYIHIQEYVCLSLLNGNPLQYSCLENSLDRGAWWASMGLQQVGHDRVTSTRTYTHTHQPCAANKNVIDNLQHFYQTLLTNTET